MNRKLIPVLVLLGLGLVGLLAGGARLITPSRAQPFQPTSPAEAVVRTLDPRVPLTALFSRRLEWWGAAGRMFAERPLLGVGLGRYPRLLPQYAVAPVPVENTLFASVATVG